MPRVSAPRPAVQRGLLAAVDGLSPESARTPEAAAVLATAVTEGPDPLAEQKLEAHYVARGAWRELADFYRQASARASFNADQAAWAEKLAEVL